MNEDMEVDQIRVLYNGLNDKCNEFKELFSKMVFEISLHKKEIQKLKDEKSELFTELQTKSLEVEVLQTEITGLNENMEMMKTELMEVRNENDVLISRLTKRDLMAQQIVELAKNVNGIVNSLPAFSEQMVLAERPNSMTAFGSFADMDGIRLRPSESKEETYHSTRLASGQTSNETYYDANGSHRSSLTNGSTGVRPKVQQNQVSSTVTSTPVPLSANKVLNESMITGLTDSTNYYIDENNNLRLKTVKVPIGRLMAVGMAYITSPSDFWVHINPKEVNDYFHVIQVRQNDMKSQPNSCLTAADIELGMYCAAIYSFDGYWYRAQVIGITYDHPIERDSIKSVEVLFIDWGNTEERPLSVLLKLSTELNKRRQAINCYVQGCAHRSKWPLQSVKEFEDLLKDKLLKVTFHKSHKVDEVLNSIVFPIDLMFESDGGSYANINELLIFPEILDEEADQTLVVVDQSNGQSADTVICNGGLNVQSNPTLSVAHSKSDTKNKNQDLKSKSNQNCALKEVSESTIRVPKSMPHLNGLPKSCGNLSDIRIPPPIIPDTPDGLIVQASHPESPSYMYIHISDPQVGSAQFEDLEEQLNAFYSKERQEDVTQPDDVSEGSFWATRFSRDNRWYRCRVLQKEENRALINYVDWGNEEWVDIKYLKPLSRRLAIYPAMAVRCRLSNVCPFESVDWSEDALLYFHDLIESEDTPPLTAFIAHKPKNHDFDSILDVFLWTIDANSEDILINLQLVVNKFATTDNQEWVKEAARGLREKTPPQLMSELIPIINNVNSETIKEIEWSTATAALKVDKCHLTTTIEAVPNGEHSEPSPILVNGFGPKVTKSQFKGEVIPEMPDDYPDDDEWDPIAEDAACDLNNYNVRPNDAGIATLGFRYAYDDTEEERIHLEDMDLLVGGTFVFKLTSIISPFNFYGILPYGPIDLNKTELSDDCLEDKEIILLSTALKNKYSKGTNKEDQSVFPAIGSLVAFRDDATDTYYRGRVLEHHFGQKSCLLFCVDLGIEMAVKRNQMFKLGKFFCQLPAQAIECSLTGIQPPDKVGWTQQSIDAINELLSDKMIFAHIMYGKFEGKYFVDLSWTEGEVQVSLNERLIEDKLAQSVVQNGGESVFSDEIYNSESDE